MASDVEADGDVEADDFGDRLNDVELYEKCAEFVVAVVVVVV